jgi:hypothetical protein
LNLIKQYRRHRRGRRRDAEEDRRDTERITAQDDAAPLRADKISMRSELAVAIILTSKIDKVNPLSVNYRIDGKPYRSRAFSRRIIRPADRARSAGSSSGRTSARASRHDVAASSYSSGVPMASEP